MPRKPIRLTSHTIDDGARSRNAGGRWTWWWCGTVASAVASEKLADGVYRITGGYVALAVEFKDHVVVLEGGQSEARGLAILAETKRLIPDKRISTSSTPIRISITQAGSGRLRPTASRSHRRQQQVLPHSRR